MKLCSNTVGRGSEGMLPRKFLTKKVWSAAIWGVPKYVITNLKINSFKEKIIKKI